MLFYYCQQVALEAELNDCQAKTWAEAEEKFAAERATAEVSWCSVSVSTTSSICGYSRILFILSFILCWHVVLFLSSYLHQFLCFFLLLLRCIPLVKAALTKANEDAEVSGLELIRLKEQAEKDATSLESAKQMVVALRNECASAKAEAAAATAVVAAAASSDAVDDGTTSKITSSSSSLSSGNKSSNSGEATTTASSDATVVEGENKQQSPDGDDSSTSHAANHSALAEARKRISVLSTALKAAEARAEAADEENRRLEMLLANNNGKTNAGSDKDGNSSSTSDGKGGQPAPVNLRAQAASAAILLADARSEVCDSMI